MEIKQITDLVETRFLPLISNINTSFDLKYGEVTVSFNEKYVHVIYRPFDSNQFTSVTNKDWTSVTVCLDHITDDDLVNVHDSLIEIWEQQVKESKLLLAKRERIKKEIAKLENELLLCD